MRFIYFAHSVDLIKLTITGMCDIMKWLFIRRILHMDNRSTSFKRWYAQKRTHYEELAQKVHDILIKELPKDMICNSTFRAKEMDSALKKSTKMILNADNKYVLKYDDYKKDITDYAGVRIVVRLTSEVDYISKIVENLFDIDEQNSVNKADELKDNKIGYLAKHYIVRLKQNDCTNPTDRKYRELPCEIQIKTILQDVWAQLFHDRLYKSSESLTPELIRNTNLVAGVLELVDNNISSLVELYDKNKVSTRDTIDMWVLLQNEIYEKSLVEFAQVKLENDSIPFVNPEITISILKKLNYAIIGDIQDDLDNTFLDALKSEFKSYLFNIDKFYLYLCIFNKTEDFFKVSGCKEISQKSYSFLIKYIDNLEHYISKYNVQIV